MKKFFQKQYQWAAIFSILLASSFIFIILDVFVIPKSITMVNPIASTTNSTTVTTTAANTNQSDASITDTSYEDENIKITIETVRKNDTTYYVADIQISDVSYLKTAFAEGTYGRNIKDTTSNIAEESKAIFAINGDYYGFRDYGYVIRNGTLYRDTVGESDDEALVIDKDGNFSIVKESEVSAQTLSDEGSWQVLSFGPSLIEDGEITVDSNSEVSQSKSSNPRTAIGQISALHYVIVVSDGRTSESTGLSLLQLAQEFKDRGCTTAYNLDGGGSSTMYFNGEIVNNPTDGRTDGERKVSDIVYFGY